MSRFSRFVAAVTLSASVVPLLSGTASAEPATYVVKPGDSLYGIATKLGLALGDLLTANGLVVTSTILPGQQLAVPSAPGAPPAAAVGGSYTVRAGDSLSRIAARHQVSLAALLQVNGMTVTSLILPGKTIVLPTGAVQATAPSTSAPVAAAAATNTVAQAGAGSYTVQAGDSLSRIAARHQVGLAALLQANGMTASSLILPGKTIALPAGAVMPAPPSTSTSTSTSSSASTAGAAPTGTAVDAVIAYALAQQGKEYQFFAAGPERFDCSGLTKAAYAQVGVTLVHQSARQAQQGVAVDFANESIRPGDLVFLITRDAATINHVGLAISATQWVHAPAAGQTVRVGSIPTNSVVAVRRLV